MHPTLFPNFRNMGVGRGKSKDDQGNGIPFDSVPGEQDTPTSDVHEK
jgi:hypothetical protein